MDKNDIRNWRLRVFWFIPILFLIITLEREFPIENIGLSFLGGLLCGVSITTMIFLRVLYDHSTK